MAFIQRGQDLLSYPPGVNRSEKWGGGSERREEKEMKRERERITKFQTPVLTVLSQTYVNLQNPFITKCSGHTELRPQSLIDT
ncbi:hypothetical protein QQF64_002387 [Cirrhinus molitorella]|uniref:Uncharacterized protein n=1 Tax=Cirrhinus molitorella TaxID=172907 RepID=A0ABR3MPZ5_9TELE